MARNSIACDINRLSGKDRRSAADALDPGDAAAMPSASRIPINHEADRTPRFAVLA